MKFSNYFLYFICISYSFSYSQNISVSEIAITDTVLLHTIENFIEERIQQYPKLDSIGYIEVIPQYVNERAKEDELMVTYRIKDQYASIHSNSELFPHFYSYVKNKLVLLYNINPYFTDTSQLNQRSKQILIKKINKCLGQTEHLVAKDAKGNIVIDDKDFRPSEEYTIHGGLLLNIFKNREVTITKTTLDN